MLPLRSVFRNRLSPRQSEDRSTLFSKSYTYFFGTRSALLVPRLVAVILCCPQPLL